MRGAGYYPSDAEVAALMAHVRFLAGLDADAPPPAGGASAGDQQPGGARRPLSKARPASQQQQQQQQGAASAAPARRGSSGTGAAQDADEGVDFGTFLALYVNHRPLGGATMADIEAAFATLAAGGGGGGDGGGGGEACAVIDGRRLAEALQRGGDKMGADELERALQVRGWPGEGPVGWCTCVSARGFGLRRCDLQRSAELAMPPGWGHSDGRRAQWYPHKSPRCSLGWDQCRRRWGTK